MTTVQLVAKNHVSMTKSDSMFVCCFTSHRDSFFFQLKVIWLWGLGLCHLDELTFNSSLTFTMRTYRQSKTEIRIELV